MEVRSPFRGTKLQALESQWTITNMVVYPWEFKRSITKSTTMCDPGRCGTGRGLSKPSSSCGEQVWCSWLGAHSTGIDFLATRRCFGPQRLCTVLLGAQSWESSKPSVHCWRFWGTYVLLRNLSVVTKIHSLILSFNWSAFELMSLPIMNKIHSLSFSRSVNESVNRLWIHSFFSHEKDPVLSHSVIWSWYWYSVFSYSTGQCLSVHYWIFPAVWVNKSSATTKIDSSLVQWVSVWFIESFCLNQDSLINLFVQVNQWINPTGPNLSVVLWFSHCLMSDSLSWLTFSWSVFESAVINVICSSLVQLVNNFILYCSIDQCITVQICAVVQIWMNHLVEWFKLFKSVKRPKKFHSNVGFDWIQKKKHIARL